MMIHLPDEAIALYKKLEEAKTKQEREKIEEKLIEIAKKEKEKYEHLQFS